MTETLKIKRCKAEGASSSKDSDDQLIPPTVPHVVHATVDDSSVYTNVAREHSSPHISNHDDGNRDGL